MIDYRRYRFALPIVVDDEVRHVVYRIRDRRNPCPAIVQWAIEEHWHLALKRWMCSMAYGAPRPTFNLSTRPARIAVIG